MCGCGLISQKPVHSRCGSRRLPRFCTSIQACVETLQLWPDSCANCSSRFCQQAANLKQAGLELVLVL